MADERRQDPRVPLREAAEVRFTSWQLFALIYTINISKGGMSLELSRPEPVGATVRVRLKLPEGEPLELGAVVRHCSPGKGGQFSVGVQFTDLDDAKKAGIERTIRKHGGTLSSSLTPRGK